MANTLHIKLTGAMLLVLAFDGAGYLLAVTSLPDQSSALVSVLEDIFVAVAILSISVGLVLPGHPRPRHGAGVGRGHRHGQGRDGELLERAARAGTR